MAARDAEPKLQEFTLEKVMYAACWKRTTKVKELLPWLKKIDAAAPGWQEFYLPKSTPVSEKLKGLLDKPSYPLPPKDDKKNRCQVDGCTQKRVPVEGRGLLTLCAVRGESDGW